MDGVEADADGQAEAHQPADVARKVALAAAALGDDAHPRRALGAQRALARRQAELARRRVAADAVGVDALRVAREGGQRLVRARLMRRE